MQKDLRIAGVKRLLQDDFFAFIIEDIKDCQSRTFLNPQSTLEEREKAHEIVRGVHQIEMRLAQILNDEAISEKRKRG